MTVERKLWTSMLYFVLFFLICVTVWQISTTSEQLSTTVAMYTLFSQNSSAYVFPIYSLSPEDYDNLIDIKFTFEVLNLPCNESSPLLLIVVHSAPKNFLTRSTIRATWGRKTDKMKILFMIGHVNNRVLKQRIKKENEAFGDLIQGSFLDAYKNMTYKHVMAFKYVIYHCPQAKYILKTDDDVFVNTPLLMNYLNTDLSPYGGSRMLFCSLMKESMAFRSYRSKWRVSFKEYRPKKYPPYCSGWALLYSPDVIFKLYSEAQVTDYFWIDDVHITGTLVQKTHLAHTDIEHLILTRKELFDIENKNGNQTAFLFGCPDLTIKSITTLWNHVTQHKVPSSVAKD